MPGIMSEGLHEGLSPTVQHREEADLRAQMLGSGGDGAQGRGGRAEQDAVDLRFVLEGDRCDVVRDGEDNVKYSHARISAVRCSIHAARASD